ncbi:MAG: hypothetical protein DHS20C19_02910 [Acidimicrobiales bacterium]|nr:MAG: hypothetical protein DHS20C19_02910 [Acidimicrobiales bacterium]
MQAMRDYIDFMQLAVEYNMTLLGVDIRDERGAISTEMAVVIAAMVAIAVVLGGIFIAKAQSNANNIPDTVPAPA